MGSSSQTLISYLISPPLYVLRDSSLLFHAVSSLTGLVFGSGYPYWLIGLGIFLEFIDEIVKVLLFLLPVLQRSLLELWIVFLFLLAHALWIRHLQTTYLEQFFFGRRYPVYKGWASNAKN